MSGRRGWIVRRYTPWGIVDTHHTTYEKGRLAEDSARIAGRTAYGVSYRVILFRASYGGSI
jgi:hypothetical protein